MKMKVARAAEICFFLCIIWITYETTICAAFECDDGYGVLLQNGNTTCKQCHEGCSNCTHHTFDTNSSFTKCTSCSDGYYLDEYNTYETVICKKCKEICKTCDSYGSCTRCADGYGFYLGGDCDPLWGIILMGIVIVAGGVVILVWGIDIWRIIKRIRKIRAERRRAARHTEDTIPVSRKVKYDKSKQDNVEMALLGTNRDTKQVFSKPQYEESEQDTVEMPLLGEKGEGAQQTLASQESRIHIGIEIQRCISLKKDTEIQDDQELIIVIEKEPEIQHITSTKAEKGARKQAYLEMANTNKQVQTDKIKSIQEVQEPVFKIYPPHKQHTKSLTNADKPIVTPTCYEGLPVCRNNEIQYDHFRNQSYKAAIKACLTEKRRWKSTSDLTSDRWSKMTEVNESSQTTGCLQKTHMMKRRCKSTSDLTSNRWCLWTEVNESSQTIDCLEDMSLEQVCLIFGSQSEELNNKCQSIVHSLTTITGVKRVWPSYKASNKASLVFLVLIEPETDRRELLLPYPLRLKSVKSKNDENDNVEASEVYVNASLPDEDMDKLNNVFDRVAFDLLNIHSNLCAILISPLKSRQTGTELIETPCFVLFVYMKGLIPINEREFPEFIDGIPTDVRDGIFSVFGAHRAKEFHNPLQMGCMLSRCRMGTIGPFLTDQNGKTFCLTSAHVLLSPAEYKILQTKRKMNENDFQNGHTFYLDVYQPTSMDNAGNTYKPFGQIRSVIYNDGIPNSVGVEVGLVEVTDPQRTPITGEFPEGQFDNEGFTKDSPLKFKNGLMVDKNTDTVDRTEVLKYGCETGITIGLFKRSGRNVYRDTLTEGLTITLCNQIQINSTGNTKFAEPGDSGALVLVPNNAKEGDMRAVGIVTGGINNTISVTPIWDILEGFNQPLTLKRF